MASEGGLPPALLKVGVPAAGILLVSIFVFIGFPYAALGERITDELKRSQNIRIEYQKLGPGWTLFGPAVVLSEIRATLDGGEVLEFQKAKLRPALSLEWFRANPAVAFTLEAGSGSAAGTVYTGDRGGLVLETHQIDLTAYPIGRRGPFAGIRGVLDLDLDYRAGEAGPEGSATFEAADGAIDLVNFPVPIPFTAFSGSLTFGDEAAIVFERVALAGPVVNGTASGSALAANSLAEAPLQLDLELQAKESVAARMRRAGIRMGRAGKLKTRVTGTLANPQLQ